MTKEAIKQALEVFGGCNWHDEIVDGDWADKAQSAIKALEEALKQEQGEPMGKFAKFTDGIWREVTDGSAGVTLYTHPKEWVGLTGEEIWEACMESPVELDCSADELYVISRIIEAKLKEKNGY